MFGKDAVVVCVDHEISVHPREVAERALRDMRPLPIPQSRDLLERLFEALKKPEGLRGVAAAFIDALYFVSFEIMDDACCICYTQSSTCPNSKISTTV
jgi:hypothetical protein